ncbi:MAG TPA: nucleotidyltransferase domain-containing protein [Anaerolineae bacterium]
MKVPAKAQLETIAKRYGLRLIVLFGSQVTGRTHPESDVDVAVLARRALTAAQRNRLWMELSDTFQAEVDLAMLNHAEPLLLYQVACSGKPLYEDDQWRWAEFKGYAFRYYEDTRKFRDDLARYLKREIQGPRYAG